MQRTTMLSLIVALAAHALAGQEPLSVSHAALTATGSLYKTVQVEPGAGIEVRITDTCREKFSYSHSGMLKEEAPDGGLRAQGAFDPVTALGVDCVIEADAKPVTIDIVHKPQFGGYIVRLDANPGVATRARAFKYAKGKTANDADAALADSAWMSGHPTPSGADILERLKDQGVGSIVELGNAQVVVAVQEAGWTYGLAGGFTVSKLTDQEFGIHTETVGGNDVSVVFRDRSAESSARLGFAGFVHVSHSNVNWAALSFGLGVSSTSEVSFFIGPSWRMGGHAFLSLGYNWGQVQRLPNGVEVGKPPSDPNALSNLPTRTDGAVFLALSYSFIGNPQGILKGPFEPPTTTTKPSP